MELRDLKKQYEILKPDIDLAVMEVMRSARFISGPQVAELEEQLADYTGSKYCISCGNGTDALTLALKVWGVGNGDAVFVPDFTFFSSGECPACEGATPIFVDVDPKTFNLDPNRLEQAVERVEREGKYTPRVVIAVDLFGQPADYDRILPICRKHHLLLLEDGAQGFGGSIRGKMACSFGDIGTTSFFPAKPLGCYGDGGAVFTDNPEWAEKIRSLSVHGKSKTSKYDNLRLGMNSRMDTMQAAILLVKLRAFREHELQDVNEAAGNYYKEFQSSTLQLPVIREGYFSSWAQFTVQLPEHTDRARVQDLLCGHNIPTMVYYGKPLHLQKAFEDTDSADADCPATERLCRSVLSLPMSPYLTGEQAADAAEHLLNAVRSAEE